MSHTGRVHEGEDSPGLIRVITTGHQFTSTDNHYHLVFRKPAEYNNGATLNPLQRFQERFVILWRDNYQNPSLQYGEAVSFNRINIDRAWASSNAERFSRLKRNYRDKLIRSIPQHWLQFDEVKTAIDRYNGDPDEFPFTYIATEVERLPSNHALEPFYSFIDNLNRETVEDLLFTGMDAVRYYEFHDLNEVSIRGDSGEVTVDISSVYVVDEIEFGNGTTGGRVDGLPHDAEDQFADVHPIDRRYHRRGARRRR